MLARLVLLSFPAVASAAGDEWTKLAAPNFEVFTTAGQGRGREVLQHFEQMRGFFLSKTGWNLPPGPPVRVVVFRSEKQFDLYRDSKIFGAYYLSGRDRDYIVMGPASSQGRRLAAATFLYLLIRKSGMQLPLWLQVGLAELYSTLTPFAGKVKVGHPLEHHVRTLATSRWYHLETLFAVTHDSPV
ncbi:MAG: hypothetical protein AAB225_05590 [Acidobacteriota bacterium]